MTEHQTQHKLSARSVENRKTKRNDHKIKSNSNNNVAISSVSEDQVDLSPISEITDANNNEDSIIKNKSSNSAEITSDSEDPLDLSPISDITEAISNEDSITFLEETSCVTFIPSDKLSEKLIDKTELDSANSIVVSNTELETFNFGSVEAEIAVIFLKNVKPKILSSVTPQYRKLMDEIFLYVMQDISGMQKNTNQHFVLSAKKRFMFLCAFVWLIGVVVVLFFTFDNDTHHGPLPT